MVALANSAISSIEVAAKALNKKRHTMVLKPKLRLELSQAHARKLLFGLMSYLSEHRYAAGWLVDLEFILWEEASKRSGPGLLPYERAGLRVLAALAGGWWVWSKDGRFVPMARWLTMYRRHQEVFQEAQLRQLFTTDAAVARWLDTPDRSLNKKTPREMLATARGASRVDNLIRAMIHGVPP